MARPGAGSTVTTVKTRQPRAERFLNIYEWLNGGVRFSASVT